LQLGHFPIQRGETYPHDWQTYFVWILATGSLIVFTYRRERRYEHILRHSKFVDRYSKFTGIKPCSGGSRERPISNTEHRMTKFRYTVNIQTRTLRFNTQEEDRSRVLHCARTFSIFKPSSEFLMPSFNLERQFP
jgi:hypothetical protein